MPCAALLGWAMARWPIWRRADAMTAPLPPDEISTAQAGVLLGLSQERIRQLCASGYIARHRKGFTTATAAVLTIVDQIEILAKSCCLDPHSGRSFRPRCPCLAFSV